VFPAKDLVLITTNGVRSATNFVANEVQIMNSGYFQGTATNTGNFQVGGDIFPGANVTASGIASVLKWSGLANTVIFTNGIVHQSGSVAYDYNTIDAVETNSTANSNLTVNFATTVTRQIWLTNNITLTNFTGYADGQNISVKWKLIPQLVNRTVAWPTIGSPGYGISLGTNQGSMLWTTLTNGVTYQLTFDSWGTNIDATIAAFYR
jgi:hypothetical protein